MKKTIISGIALASLAFTGTAFADTNTSTTTPPAKPMLIREEARELRKDIREARHEDREEIKDLRAEMRVATGTASSTEIRKKIDDKKRAMASERAMSIVKRLNHQISKLDELVVRVAERIATFKAKGYDVSASEAKLAEAKTAIADAKAKVALLTTSINTAVATNTNITNLAGINEALKMLKPQITEVEKAIRTADKAIRGAMKTRFPKATPSTATPTSAAGTTTATTTTN